MKLRRAELMTAAILLVLGVVALFSSTFAWLNVSRVPFISDLEISVITDNSLLIAPDVQGKPGEWDNYLDASEYLKDMAPLLPVTYVNGEFRKLQYDETGRADILVPLNDGDITYAMNPTNAGGLLASEGEARSTGHMIALECWLKCEGSSADVFLSAPKERADGQMGGGTYCVGKPIWDETTGTHQNGGYGSETTLRLGFEIQHADADANFTGGKSFYMYEPNANIHNDESITGYVETASASGGAIIDNAHHIIQNASRWNEANPALADVVVYETGGFVQNPSLLSIKAGELVKVTLYYWMEGQDIDCIAKTVPASVTISSNIQFGVKETLSRDTNIVRK